MPVIICYFPDLIVILIIFNFTKDEDTKQRLDNVNIIITYIYMAEVIIKLIGLGIVPYFRDGWNV